MWHEAAGGRGSSKIATCMHHYLKSLPDHIKRVFLFSETCSGQNRSQFFSTMCLNAVKSMPISGIDHIYMESGHSQMECDSVHSTIERALKTQDVYNPGDYYRIVGQGQAAQSILSEDPFHTGVSGFQGSRKIDYTKQKLGYEWRYCPMAKDKVDALT